MAFRAYTGLRASRGQLALTRNVLRQSLPTATPLSRHRGVETSAQAQVWFSCSSQLGWPESLSDHEQLALAGCTDEGGKGYTEQVQAGEGGWQKQI